MIPISGDSDDIIIQPKLKSYPNKVKQFNKHINQLLMAMVEEMGIF